MATSPDATLRDAERGPVVSVIRMLVAGGLTATAVFVLCWAGAFLPYADPTYAYIGLFTTAYYPLGEALAEGLCWSLLFGSVVGAIFALIYNVTACFGRS